MRKRNSLAVLLAQLVDALQLGLERVHVGDARTVRGALLVVILLQSLSAPDQVVEPSRQQVEVLLQPAAKTKRDA